MGRAIGVDGDDFSMTAAIFPVALADGAQVLGDVGLVDHFGSSKEAGA